MPTVTKESPTPAKRPDTELKRLLVEHLDMLKRPNDVVRVTQVSDHHFRVNTMSPVRVEHSVLPTYRITKSQFLHVDNKTGELVISDQTRGH